MKVKHNIAYHDLFIFLFYDYRRNIFCLLVGLGLVYVCLCEGQDDVGKLFPLRFNRVSYSLSDLIGIAY